MTFTATFKNQDINNMTIWFIVVIIFFAVIFAINSSIHSFLVVKYAKSDKLAKSVGFYYMSNACGRLLGTIGSGVLYTYVGDYVNDKAGTNATAGIAACFLAGTLSSLIAALITIKIDDNEGGLKCGPCTLVGSKPDNEDMQEETKEEIA
jgi:magnesium-transporting ATPase (P-type)